MHLKDTLSATKIASRKFAPKAHLIGLLNKIKYYSLTNGYCFAWRKTLAKILGLSRSQLKKQLRELEESGWIFRERFGRRSIIWTPENFANRDQILAKHPPSKIGRKIMKNIAEFCDPKIDQILASKVAVSEPVFLGQNTRVNEPLREPYHEPYQPQKNTPICLERNIITNARALNIGNTRKEKVVEISKAQAPNLRPQILPQTKKIPPLFSRDQTKEQISLDGKVKLYASYDRELADKKIANATVVIERLARDEKYFSEFYKMGVDGLALRYCEEQKRQNDARKDKKVKAQEPKAVATWEQILEMRRQKVKNNSLIMNYGSLNKGGFLIDSDKVGRTNWDRLSRTGMSYENPNFDENLDRLIFELQSVKKGARI